MHVSPKVKSTGKKQQAFLPHSVPVCSDRQGFSCASLNPSCCRLVSVDRLPQVGAQRYCCSASRKKWSFLHLMSRCAFGKVQTAKCQFIPLSLDDFSNFEKVLWTAWESQWLQTLLVLWEEKMLKHSPKASSSAPAYCRTSCCMSHWCSSFVFCRNAVTVGYLHTLYNSRKMHHDSTSLSPWICFN